MTFPNLPTDSLYKFMALVGVVLAVGASAGFVVGSYHLKIKDVEARNVAMVMEVQSQVLDIPLVFKELSTQQIFEFMDDAASAKRKVEEVEVLRELLLSLRWTVLIYLIWGVFFAVLGFRLWYVRVQQPLDQLLREQLEAIKGGCPGGCCTLMT